MFSALTHKPGKLIDKLIDLDVTLIEAFRDESDPEGLSHSRAA